MSAAAHKLCVTVHHEDKGDSGIYVEILADLVSVLAGTYPERDVLYEALDKAETLEGRGNERDINIIIELFIGDLYVRRVSLSVVVINRTPFLLLAKNAFFRGNAGFIGAFMLVSAFLGYVDGRESHEILLDMVLGAYLGFLAIRAYGTESKMYKYIWGETYYKMQKILHCDPATLSEKESKIRRKYATSDNKYSLEQHVTIMAVEYYMEQHKIFEEQYAKEHRIAYYIGNAALLIIILNIGYSIITHI